MPEINNNGNGNVSLKIDIAVLKEWREAMERWNELAFDEISDLSTNVTDFTTALNKLDKRLAIMEVKAGVYGALSGLVSAIGLVIALLKLGVIQFA